MRQVYMVALLSAVSIATAGCGGSDFKLGNPWDPVEAPFFDDGVDMIDDPASLSGKWRYQHENEFDGRVQLSDFIAEVDIQSIQTTIDRDRVSAKRIDVKVINPVYGQAPGTSLSLVSKQEAPGHQLVLRYERRLSGRFLLYVRWFENESGRTDHHFHLSSAAASVLQEVEQRVKSRKREEAEASTSYSR